MAVVGVLKNIAPTAWIINNMHNFEVNIKLLFILNNLED
jgi:hypothetical protein